MPHYTECMTENVFTWQCADTGEELTFAVDRMGPWCEANDITIYRTPVDPKWAEQFRIDRGIEPHRVARLTPECFKTPVIYCEMDGGASHLLVDGHHRYVYAAKHKLPEILAYILTRKQWEPFIVTGLPKYGHETLTTMFSGIK